MHFRDDVFIVAPHLAASVARIMRDAIVGINRARISEEGKAQKTTEIYDYLRSDAFANAIARINDRIVRNRTLLEQERSLHVRWWSEREESDVVIYRETTVIESRIKDIVVSPQGHDTPGTLVADVA
jgi:hypothetical protein